MGLYEDIINKKKKKDKENEALFKEITSGKFKQRELPKKEEPFKKTVKQEETMSPITKPKEKIEDTMTPLTNISILEQNKNISDTKYENKLTQAKNQAKAKGLSDEPSYKNVKVGKNYETDALKKDVQNKKEYRTYLKEETKEEKDERAVSRSAYETQKARNEYEGPSGLELLMSPIRGAKSMFNSNFREDLQLSTGERLDSYNDTIMALNQSSDNGLYNLAYGIGSEIGKQTAVAALNATGLPLGTTQYFSDIYSDQYNDARKQGYDDQKASRYATVSVAGEALFEKLLGGLKSINKGKSLGEKGISEFLSNFIKSKPMNDIVSSILSEGTEEFLEEYLGEFNRQMILDERFDGSKFVSQEMLQDAVKSFIIGAATGGYTTGLSRTVNTATNPYGVAYEDAIYNIEATNGKKMSDYNKDMLVNIANNLQNQGIKVNGKQLVSIYNANIEARKNNFQNNALSQFTNLDEQSRVLYNNLINDASNLIEETGIGIAFDSTLKQISTWSGNTLVINPTMTDTPIKTLLLKEMGNRLVDQETKNELLEKIKKSGIYETLRDNLIAQGIEENQIDNEIVSLELNSIFESEEKLKEFAKTSKLALDEIKSSVDNLSSTITPTTKDYVYIKSLSDRINSLNLNENNISGIELQQMEKQNLEQQKIEEKQNKKQPSSKKAISNDLGRFDYDTTKYKGMGKKTLENAAKSGIVGNNQEAREFVNYLAKISEDKNLEFNFIDDKSLDKKIKDAKGKNVNIDGYIDNGVIHVNLDSENALNVIVGHEITHALENSKYYEQLQKTVLDFLGKEKADSELKDLARLYSNVKGADINNELISNVVARELFTNKQFLNDLTKDRNLFQRIFDEVKYLWNEFRGKNTKIDKLYHDFVKVYNDKVRVKSDFKYSLSDISTMKYEKNLYKEPYLDNKYDTKLENALPQDNNGNILTEAQYNKYKDSVAVDKDGYLIVGYHNADRSRPFFSFKPGNVKGSNLFGIWATDSQFMGKTYSYMQNIPYTKKVDSIDKAKLLLEEYSEGKYTLNKVKALDYIKENFGYEYVRGLNKYEDFSNKDVLDKIEEDNKRDLLTEREYNMYKALANDDDVYAIQKLDGTPFEMDEENDKKIYYSENDVFKNISEYFRGKNTGYTYPVYMNLKNPYIVDCEGRLWKQALRKIDNEKIEEFRNLLNSKDRIENIKNLYNESKNKYEKYREDLNELYRVQSVLFYYPNFKYNNEAYRNYLSEQSLWQFDDYDDLLERAGDSINFPKKETKLSEMINENNIEDYYKDAFDKFKDMTAEEFYNYMKYYYETTKEINNEVKYFNAHAKDELKLDKLSPHDIMELRDLDIKGDYSEEELIEKFSTVLKTDAVVERVIESVESGNEKYDGVIFKNIKDPGYYANDFDFDEIIGNVYVMFSSNQMDFIDNENPTDDEDLRYMLSQKQEQKGDYNVYGKDIKYNPLTKKTEVKEIEETPKAPTKKTLNPSEIAKLKPEDANTTPNLKKRKYNKTATGLSKQVETLQKSQLFTEAQKKKIIQDEEFAKYDKITNKQSLDEAFNRLENGGSEETVKWFNKKSTEADATDIAEGIILMKQYADNKNYDSMVEVAKKLRDMKTKTAQTLQASSIMSRMTPEGMVAYAQSELNDAYNKLVKNKTKEWIDENREQFNLTTDDVDFIMKTMQKVSQMEEGYEKKVELAKIQKLMTDKIPPEFGKSLKGWMRVSMLFNPKTQVRNVGGNALIAPINFAGDIVASWADKLISQKTKVRTTGNANSKAIIEGFKRGAYEATNDYKLGINTKNMEGNRFEIGEGKSFSEKTIIGKGLNRTESILNYMMDLGDRVFSEAWFENSLANQMKLNNVETPTQEMIDIATTEALQRTWNDNNNYTKFVLDVRKMLNKIGGENYGLGDVLIPFAKTPANLTKAIIDYSPVGLVNSIREYSKLNKAIGRGDFTAQQQHQFVQTLGKATAGTMLYVLGYALANAGVITGAEDEDKDTKNFLKNVLGVSQYSIKIGDKSFTYDWAQPLAAPLSIMANIKNKKNKETALFESIVGSLDSAGSILLEQSFLQSISDVLSDNDGVVSGLINEVLNLPSRAVPTFSKQIADLIDGTQRQTFEYDKPVKTAVNSVLVKIPFVSKTLAPKVDTMGEDILKYGGKNNIFNVMFNPANIGKENISEAGKEIYEVYKATGNKNIMPRTAPYYTGTGDNKKILSSKQIAEYQKISGGIVESAVSDIMNTDKYKSLSDDEKANTIKNIVDYAYNYAQNQVVGKEMSSTYNKANEYVNNGGKIGDYYLNQKEANYSMENPERYKVISHITTYDNYQRYNTEIAELRKNTSNDKYETTQYINNLDLGYNQKVLMFKLYYPKDHTYDTEVINYIDQSVDDYNEKVEILEKLGFKISSDGTVRW